MRHFVCDGCLRSSTEGAQVCERCHADTEALARLATIATEIYPSLKAFTPPVIFARLLFAAIAAKDPSHPGLARVKAFADDPQYRAVQRGKQEAR